MFFTDLRHFTASSNRVGLGIVGSREDHKVGPRTHRIFVVFGIVDARHGLPGTQNNKNKCACPFRFNMIQR